MLDAAILARRASGKPVGETKFVVFETCTESMLGIFSSEQAAQACCRRQPRPYEMLPMDYTIELWEVDGDTDANPIASRGFKA